MRHIKVDSEARPNTALEEGGRTLRSASLEAIPTCRARFGTERNTQDSAGENTTRKIPPGKTQHARFRRFLGARCCRDRSAVLRPAAQGAEALGRGLAALIAARASDRSETRSSVLPFLLPAPCPPSRMSLPPSPRPSPRPSTSILAAIVSLPCLRTSHGQKCRLLDCTSHLDRSLLASKPPFLALAPRSPEVPCPQDHPTTASSARFLTNVWDSSGTGLG